MNKLFINFVIFNFKKYSNLIYKKYYFLLIHLIFANKTFNKKLIQILYLKKK